jgi:hypothetical protein
MRLLVVAALGLGLPLGATDVPDCPQERAVYSLAGSTLTFFQHFHVMSPGWSATLKRPNEEPITLEAVQSNGVSVTSMLWPSDPPAEIVVSLNDSWPNAPRQAEHVFVLDGVSPRGTWRLTGCTQP